ncbi:MAG TPA: pyridoxamine 5'-phosphate oxidase family protein [Bacteroidales bacterium]|jgi:hypothetical protein|nr:pyridoxamine 5'-phosphate oxidase family protein [Bacteroidales bacterium]HNR42822.1 pyridoxamine 5'-phosphate oxidase family protein [Bacteroidales bacterium]HPM19155.1 pyridoxamine 5'-phosphate oxidase family protein [Bacteroidales bacterium]HQG76679.1 pyridoxamine 5'-phosphate oxidase family protein [Bacteroidales bacterium]
MRRKDREISDIAEIEEVIRKSDVCRIAIANEDLPYIVTMSFGYCSGDRKRIYFHCAPEGKKLDMLDRNNFVCFEFDTDHILLKGPDACDYGMAFSSVVGWGRISRVSDNDERKEGMLAIMEHYSGKRDFSFRPEALAKTLILRLDITQMTGKRRH